MYHTLLLLFDCRKSASRSESRSRSGSRKRHSERKR